MRGCTRLVDPRYWGWLGFTDQFDEASYDPLEIVVGKADIGEADLVPPFTRLQGAEIVCVERFELDLNESSETRNELLLPGVGRLPRALW